MIVRAWWVRLRGSLRRAQPLNDEMDREMAFHLDMATRRNLARGLTPEAARRQARLAFGGVEAIKEEAREAHRARLAERLVADVRFALRGLRRSPAFSIAAILTLALGIGATAAIFSAVNAVLLRPLPIPHAEDFRYIGWAWSARDATPALTDLQYEFVRDHSRAFDALAVYRTEEVHLGEAAEAQPIRGLRVTDGFFRVIGVAPVLGRAFTEVEFEGDGSVVILSDALWRTRMGADARIVGRQIRIDGAPRTVVGVLPASFRFPPAPEHAGYLVPHMVRVVPTREGNNTEVIGRLRHGASAAALDADIHALSTTFRTAYPTVADSGAFRLFTHVEVHVGSALRRTLWVLFGAISLVLLIACANTATLHLVRASERQREIAVRASLGAGPRRILQQLITEGLVLSTIATMLGLLVAVGALRGFLAAAPRALPAGFEPGIDARVLLFAIAASVITGLAFGAAAAAPAFRTRLQPALQGGSAGGTVRNARLTHALVLIQTAVAVVLLAGAAVLVASFTRLVRVDPGFDANRVVAVRLGRFPTEYDADRREQLVDRLLEQIQALPGVEQAAAAPSLPLERGLNFPIDIPERPDLAIGAVELRFVSPGYLATLGVPLREGRGFDGTDVSGAEPVAIVNEAFARHFWRDASPIGRTIQIGHFRDRWRIPSSRQHQTRVIGVAADIHEVGLDRPAKPTVLVPRAQSAQGTPLLLVRGAAPTLGNELRELIIATEPRLAPAAERLSTVLSRSIAGPRFRTLLVGSFAAFALLLAGIGIYGVIASGVQHSRREIALRIALGAGGATVAAAVMRRCLANVVAGVLVGLAGYWALRRVLTSWLYEMTPEDPRVFAAAVVALALVAAVASWIPTRRATRVDPATALRLD